MATDDNGLLGSLRDFLGGHRSGWNHHEWLGLLAELTDAGYDTSDPDHIGMALERERVKLFLEEVPVKGFGPKRRDSVAQHFSTVWNLRNASVEDLEEIPNLNHTLANALHQAMH